MSGLLHTLYTNLYSLAIGKKMTSGDLGLYNRASTLAAFPAGNITDVMYKAMFLFFALYKIVMKSWRSIF